MSDDNTAILFARRFAEKGFYVFPMYSSIKGTQKPYGWARNEVKDEDKAKAIPATNDPKEVDTWPEQVRKKYNGAMVVAYGVLGIGLVIFDLDNKDGKRGAEQFRLLQEKFKIPSPQMVVKSKTGGFHLYYAKTQKYAGAKIKSIANISIAGQKYEGVDVRGDGGMVVGPLCEGDEESWERGNYQLVKGEPGVELTQVPDDVVMGLTGANFVDPLDNLMGSSKQPDPNEDVFEILKRGEIPPVLPMGARNIGFFMFMSALKNKGFSPDTVRAYVTKLVEVTEGKENLHESIDFEDMLARVFHVDHNNPFDVATDLITRGMYRVTGHGNKIKYVLFGDNPYYASIGFHDQASIKQLLGRYSRLVPQANGKDKLINPADLLDKLFDPTHEVDISGFKPGAPEVFHSSEMGGRRFLNVWNDVRKMVNKDDLDNDAWDQFRFVVSRIFGPEGSDEYQFGLDLPAWLIQRPGLKPVVVPFIQSALRGVGKSCYLNALRHVMGASKDGVNQARSVRLEEIGARFFNPNGAALLMLDEVQFATHRNMRQEATSFWKHLKTLITASVIPVEIKGGGTFELPIVSGMLMAGNSNNHFPIEEADRRIWIIDNSPPILSKGFADKLFDLENGDVPIAVKRRTANTIRHHLANHKIKYNLADMRAPMNDIKREMFLTGLTDLEEWFVTHFEDDRNIAAKSPVVTKEMIVYALETSERMMNSRWRENPEDAFRELRKRGMVVTIKAKGQPNLTRQMNSYPNINANGLDIIQKERTVLYTSRKHSEFNNEDNEMLKQALRANQLSINEWRQASIQNRGKVISS
jgi:hypothetical protein